MFALMSKPYRRILKEYYNTYYICALHDRNVDHFSLEQFDKALFVPDYIAKLENVVEVQNNSKKLSFDQARLKIADKSEKIWSKIYNFLDTTNKGYNVKNSIYPVKSDYQKTLSKLKEEVVKVENVEVKKSLSVEDLLK